MTDSTSGFGGSYEKKVLNFSIKPDYIENEVFVNKHETKTLEEIYYQAEMFKNIEPISLDESVFQSLKSRAIDKVLLIGSGTAFYAAEIGKLYFQRFLKLSCEAVQSSEFKESYPVVNSNSLVIFLSQSGETADTLSCLEYVKSKNPLTMAICNSSTSTLSRSVMYNVPINCGREIGVASTKAFTGMITKLLHSSLEIGIARNSIDRIFADSQMSFIKGMSEAIQNILDRRDEIVRIAKSMRQKRILCF